MIFKICPVCKQVFVCREDDIALCGCSGVRLSEGQRRYMRKHYSTCLCPACLRALPEEESGV